MPSQSHDLSLRERLKRDETSFLLARDYPRWRFVRVKRVERMRADKRQVRYVAVESLKSQKRSFVVARHSIYPRSYYYLSIYRYCTLIFFSTGNRNWARARQVERPQRVSRLSCARPLRWPRFSSLTIATRNRMYLFRSKEPCTCIIVSPFSTQRFLRGRLVWVNIVCNTMHSS